MGQDKGSEEKYRDGKKMKRLIYLELRLWKGEQLEPSLEGQIGTSLCKASNAILIKADGLQVTDQWPLKPGTPQDHHLGTGKYSLSKKRNTFY